MITIEASALAGALKNAASIVATTNTLPILSNVRAIAKGGKLELVTCDLDMEFRQTIAVKGDIAFTANASKLAQIASAVPGDSLISMELADSRLTVKCGRSRWTLPTLPTDDFPTLPVDGLCEPMIVTGMTNAIRRVWWSVYREKTAGPLQSIFLHGGETTRLAAATKGTLAVAPIAAPFPKDAVDILIPEKFCGTLANFADGEINLAWDERKVRAEIGDIVLTGKLMEGSFPDYQRIIPAPQDNSIVFDPESMGQALKQVRLLEAEKTRGIAFERGDSKVTISSEALGTGSSCAEIAAACDEGFTTGLNGQFLASAIDAIGGDSVQVHQVDATSAVLIRRVVDDGAMAIIMPMRV